MKQPCLHGEGSLNPVSVTAGEVHKVELSSEPHRHEAHSLLKHSRLRVARGLFFDQLLVALRPVHDWR